MSLPTIPQAGLPAMSPESIERVKAIEALSLTLPQVTIDTEHLIHAGIYARTIMIPAGVILTGALIKIATILIVAGHVIAYIGEETIELDGYNVLPASANRKQAFLAKTDTFLTMVFPSDARCIYDAEKQFTDDADLLFSRKEDHGNKVNITGG